jgi:hypothetical protein
VPSLLPANLWSSAAALAGVVAAVAAFALRRRPAAALAAVVVSLLAFGFAFALRDGVLRAEALARARAETAAFRPREHREGGYVGSGACAECHEREHGTWHASHHRRMTDVPSSNSVVAPFDGAPVVRGGRLYRFLREGEAYYVETVDPAYEWRARGGVRNARLDATDPPERAKRRVVMTTGSHHQQLFWVAGPLPGQLDYVPLVWMIAEREWRPMRDIFVTHPERPEYLRHWNDSCIHCHSTDGVPAPVPYGEGFARETKAAELGIACESCHGPAEAHVVARRADAAAGRPGRSGIGDATIANPARLPAARSSEVCGLCHAVTHSVDQERWYREGFVYRPGEELERTEIVLRPFDPAHAAYVREREKDDPDFVRNGWWSDGEIRVSGREHSALVASPCYPSGRLSCSSCHALHGYESTDDQLKPGMRGDVACTQCHDAARFSAPEHVRHAPASEGARCQNCHTPHTTYGLTKAIRTHRVSSPSVATALATGRPDACSLCHLDRPLSFVRDRLAEWYGAPRTEIPAARDGVSAWAYSLVAGDAGVRALAAWHAGHAPARTATGPDFLARAAPLLLAAYRDDDYSAVRLQARRALGLPDDLAPPEERAAAVLRYAGSSPPAAADPLFLRGKDGALDPAAYGRVKALRDDRRIDLTE